MSDVALSRAGWFCRAIFFVLAGITWVFEGLPIVISRRRYKDLCDQKYIVDDAGRLLADYQRLKCTYEPDEGIDL